MAGWLGGSVTDTDANRDGATEHPAARLLNKRYISTAVHVLGGRGGEVE